MTFALKALRESKTERGDEGSSLKTDNRKEKCDDDVTTRITSKEEKR